MYFVLLYLLFVGVLRSQERPLRLNYLSPEIYTIDSLSIEGTKSINPKALFAVSGIQIGDTIKVPGDRIPSAIKNIWRQGIVSQVEIRASVLPSGGLRLHFVVEERARLTTITFSGASRTQIRDLEEKIQISRGRILTDLILQQIQNKVLTYYKEKGFLRVRVRFKQYEDTLISNGVRLHVAITKGEKLRVRNFRFLGEPVFSQSHLKKRFSGLGDRIRFTLHLQLLSEIVDLFVHPAHNWKRLSTDPLPKNFKRMARDYLHKHAYLNIFKSRKFEQKKYEEGKDELISFMQSKGYRNAYLRYDTIVEQSNNEVDVYLFLYSGRKHYVRDIRWVGNFVYDSATLTRILGIRKGDVYDPSLLSNRLTFNPQGADVSSLYLDQGYLFFNVQPAEVRVLNDSVDVEMRIYEGKPADIERVLIRGNNRTREHVLRRELRTLPGEQFSRADILRSQQQLSQLPYIDAQSTKPVPIPNPETQKVDIEWQIEEKAGDQVELSAGWGGGVGFVGSLGFVLNNFSMQDVLYPKRWRPLPIGDGQRLAIRFRSNGRSFTSVSTSFTEPWLGGHRRNNLTVGYTFSRERYFSLNIFTGSFSLHGTNLSLVRSLRWPDDYFTLGYFLSYNGYQLRNATNRSLGFTTGNANAVSLRTAFARSDIDNPIYPRSGSYFSISTELTPPYSLFREQSLINSPNEKKYQWVEYNKWLFDLKTYIEILPKLVVESRIHTGAIGRYSKKAIYTPFERFALGGDGQAGQNFILGTDIIGLRGYSNNSITPIDVENNIEGGRYFVKGVFELRYLVLELPAGMVYVLSFLEGGNAWNDFLDFSFYDTYRSLGVGVRLNVPSLGIIGLDWGRAFDILPGQSSLGSQFHFTIGTSIR